MPGPRTATLMILGTLSTGTSGMTPPTPRPFLLPAPDSQASPVPAEFLRIVTYNVHHGEGMDEQLDLERIAAVIRDLEPDLVALQEVDARVERTDFIDQAATYGELAGMEHRFGDFMPYQGGQYGMAVMSRWPILETINHRLPDGAEPRSALAIRVRSPRSGRELEFVGVHLYRTAEERLAQAETLRVIYANSQIPVILAGDFNSEPGSEVMRRISDAWGLLEKGADDLTFPSSAPNIEIDFFAIRPAAAFRVVSQRLLDEPVASDHRPLFVELAWPTPSPKESEPQ